MELKHGPAILDGGLSNVLEGFGCDLNDDLWSARLLATNPELIVNAHLAFLEAGADIITSSSYQASEEAFRAAGFSIAEAQALLLKSVKLAQDARNIHYKRHGKLRKIHLAASFGPYGAFLANGSEYTGNYDVDENKLTLFHKKKIQLLEKSNVDFFAFETIPNLSEVKVLSEVLAHCSKPSWVSISCQNDQLLNDGNRIEDAALILKEASNIFAIGVNCTAPQYMVNIIKTLKKNAPNKKIIVYPNSGEVYQKDSRTWLGTSNPVNFEIMAKEWLENGAHIIGGCCRIGPEHIKRLSNLR